MNNINIGILTGNHYPRLGGMEFATHFLAEQLNKLPGVKVGVACSTMPEIPSGFEYPYPCYRAKSLSYATPWLYKMNVRKMMREQEVNILHGPMLHGGGYDALVLGRKFGLPVVVQSHGSDVQVVDEIGYGAWLYPDLQKKIHKVIKEADRIIAVSSINKHNIIDLGAQPDKITVINNGIQYSKIQEIPFIDLRSKYGLNDDEFLLITVGRNSPVKRMQLLFEALQLLKDFNKIKCVCVGPLKDLKDLVKTYGIERQVVLTGPVPENLEDSIFPPYPELINLYRSSDLYITTSYVESFGMAALDALASGIPVLIGIRHGVKDVITENQTGWVMNKETPEELAEMILQLYHDREKLKANAAMIKDSVSWLTWGYVAGEMVKIYKEILK